MVSFIHPESLLSPRTDKYPRDNLLRVGFTLFSNLALDEGMHRVMLAGHLTLILTNIVRANSEWLSHF